MKALLVISAFLFIALAVVLSTFIIVDTGAVDHVVFPWYTNTGGDESFDGSWGTSIIVDYVDGTSETLSVKPLWGNPLDVSFQDRKVSSFTYVLSAKIISELYDSVELDLSLFTVDSVVQDVGTGFGVENKLNTIVVDADAKWNEVYTLTVRSSDLIDLPLDYQYNMSFTPSGSVQYRVDGSNWVDLPLPGWYYLVFSVNSDIDDVIDDDVSDSSKWIQIDISGGEPAVN